LASILTRLPYFFFVISGCQGKGEVRLSSLFAAVMSLVDTTGGGGEGRGIREANSQNLLNIRNHLGLRRCCLSGKGELRGTVPWGGGWGVGKLN